MTEKVSYEDVAKIYKLFQTVNRCKMEDIATALNPSAANMLIQHLELVESAIKERRDKRTVSNT